MKKFLILVFAFTILTTSMMSFAEPTYKTSTLVNSATNQKRVGLIFNGNPVDNNTLSVLYNETALVPIRFLTENMGFNVKWNDLEHSVTVSSNKKTVIFWIDKNNVSVNGVSKTINYGVPPKLIDSNAMVPLRFMSEIFDAEVEWDEENFTAIINYFPLKSNEVETVINKKKLNLQKTKVQFGNIDFDKYFSSVVYNEKSFVSLRSMAEATGADLVWNGNNNSIIITSEDKELYFELNSSIVLINGIEKNIGADSAPTLMSKPGEEFSSTMLPLRFIVEELGYILDWDSNEWTSNISFSENQEINLTNININEKSSGIENLVFSLDSISSPKVKVDKDLITITVPNTYINIDGKNSFTYTPDSFPLNFITAEESVGATIIKIGFDSTVNTKKYFDGNNLVIGFQLPAESIMYTDYNMTFSEFLDRQITLNPVTDKYMNLPVYIRKSNVKITGTDKATTLVNSTPLKSDSIDTSHTYGNLAINTSVNIKRSIEDFYEIEYTDKWRYATPEDIRNSMSITGLEIGSPDSFKYLDLSKLAGITSDIINSKILVNKGILTGKGEAYLEGSKLYNINEIYLMSHSILETGSGSSQLANGVVVSEVNGKPVTPKKVYNMYGIGAIDSAPLKGGSERAYNEGWDTPEKAIIGGAKFVSEKYVNNPGNNQNTIYEMRWDHNTKGASYLHQYATDIDWANKQVKNIKSYYDLLDNYTLYYDLPRFK